MKMLTTGYKYSANAAATATTSAGGCRRVILRTMGTDVLVLCEAVIAQWTSLMKCGYYLEPENIEDSYQQV